jgi:hypothetical protein
MRLVFLLVATLLASIGCVGTRGVEPRFRRVRIDGAENTFAIGPRIYSGSSPDGERAFAALAGLGVRTIVSVDGIVPDAEAAGRHGIRYIHLPVGYDGIAATNALRLVKAVATVPGPVYLHCHHGRHRGPAAVALVCEALENWTPAMAREWMHAAGTATNYTGLYRAAAEFRRPTPEDLAGVPDSFPARAPGVGLVAAMVNIDARFDALDAIRGDGFRVPAGWPPGMPSGEALQMLEVFREARRTGLGMDRGPRYRDGLENAERAAEGLNDALKALETERTAERSAVANAAFQTLRQACAACHRAVRD